MPVKPGLPPLQSRFRAVVERTPTSHPRKAIIAELSIFRQESMPLLME
jgi:hypothetical protein